jgi:hypothetical protein
MKLRKRAEWEDRSHEPGGDEILVLVAPDIPMDQPHQANHMREPEILTRGSGGRTLISSCKKTR